MTASPSPASSSRSGGEDQTKKHRRNNDDDRSNNKNDNDDNKKTKEVNSKDDNGSDSDRRSRRKKRKDEDDRRRRNRDVDDDKEIKKRRDKKDDDQLEDRSNDKKSRRKRRRKKSSNSDHDSDSESDDSNDKRRRRQRRERHDRDRRKRSSSSRRKKKSSSSRRKRSSRSSRSKKKRRKKYSSSSESSSSSDSSSSSSSSSDSSSSSSSDDERNNNTRTTTKKVVNQKLLAKLHARGETLEERQERRAQKRAAKITSRFGYTAESNPFNDPNLHETFTWGKKKEKMSNNTTNKTDEGQQQQQNKDTLEEIETIRRRRKERQEEQDEMERLKAEESRMKELEHYDDWAKKEEEFHLQQQRQRSAIRLVEGREKPVDVLAKNLLLFGLSEEDKKNSAAVKYQERYSALDELETLEAELEEPYKLLTVLQLIELQEILIDIDSFRRLEREAMSGNPNQSIIQYWDALYLVATDEIKLIQNGGENSSYSRKMKDIRTIFDNQSRSDLLKMKDEVQSKLRKGTTSYGTDGGVIDIDYWTAVLDQLMVHLVKMDLSDMHSKMLVRQLEKLEQKKEELKNQAEETANDDREQNDDNNNNNNNQRNNDEYDNNNTMIPKNVTPDFGNLEEELGLTNEFDLTTTNNNKNNGSGGGGGAIYSWQDKYRPRKPRYFNRVKTGYDWNKYNQTHYDHDNPPPKTVQGYKFNIFYPDLVDPTKTPQYHIEPADTNDFCILRFHAGPPYEDIAFKIINREWNRSRKRGFRSTFERGVLSLYFNFTSHWYRR